MLEVGENSYITIEEADRIIADRCVLDSGTAYWEALTEEQKTAFLLESCLEIEFVPKHGVKVYADQKMEFPRHGNFTRLFERYEVPSEVKDAQAVNAYELMKIRLGSEKSGRLLSSALAEKYMRRWFCGGL